MLKDKKCKAMHVEKSYKIAEMAREVVRLPPYHGQLNPIVIVGLYEGIFIL